MGVKVREKVKDSGEWWIFINHRGTRRALKAGTKQRAKNVAKEIEEGLLPGKVGITPQGTPESVLFRDYAEKWMEQHVEMRCSRGTVNAYRIILRKHLNPEFGDTPVKDVTRSALRDYCVKKRDENFSKSAISSHLNCISGIMDIGVDDEIIPSNPCPGSVNASKAGNRRRCLTS
jgi:integrase